MRAISRGERTRRIWVRARARAAWLPTALREREQRRPVVELDSVRRRLELLLAAMYGHTFSIDAADRARPPGWLRRFVLRSSARRVASRALAATEGERILLPRALDARAGHADAIARYRLLALEQAERVARGTGAAFPADGPRIVRDLYVLSEGAAVDAAISARVKGASDLIERARADALAHRPRLALLSRAERSVEWLVRDTLENVAGTPATSPAASLEWAVATARDIRGRSYDGIRPVPHWGVIRPTTTSPAAVDVRKPPDDNLLPRESLPIPGVQGAGGKMESKRQVTRQRNASSGEQVKHESAPPEWEYDPSGAGEDNAAGAEAPRVNSEREAQQPPPTEPPANTDRLPEPVRRPDNRPREFVDVPGIQYPEWDYVVGQYREREVTVRQAPARAGDGMWAASTLRQHASLVRSVRQRFERMRAQRKRNRQQRDGDELDIAACVRALVDRSIGQPADDRLYVAVKATRPPMAIALLVDVSGSTRAQVSGALRMIDIEKMALLLASEALSAMGDRYAILTFAGSGAMDVRISTVKQFSEPNGESVRRRISALHADGFTRMGAAVRHATAVLGREQARHRLLLVLSDGQPNDIGHYVADYGVEDSRQAINEARARGVYPFCLNVDREGHEYLVRIFGPAGYTTLRRPDQLPAALLQAVKTLVS